MLYVQALVMAALLAVPFGFESKANAESANGSAPLRVDEKREASLCGDQVTLELKSVWKQQSGQPKGIVTVSSSALDRGKAMLEIGQSLDLVDGCSITLADTGRDGKYYAIFE